MATNKISTESQYVKQIYSNTQCDVIVITEDKLKYILSNLISNLRKSEQWLTPLSLFVTLLITVLTADFNTDFLNISKNIWSALFYLCLIGSFCWLVLSVFQSIKYYRTTQLINIIHEIKNHVENDTI